MERKVAAEMGDKRLRNACLLLAPSVVERKEGMGIASKWVGKRGVSLSLIESGELCAKA